MMKRMLQTVLRQTVTVMFLLGAVSLAATPAQAKEKIDLTFISGYPTTFSWTKAFAEYFAPEVNKELAKTGNYKINWNMAHGGTVVKPAGELEAIENGLGDLGIVISPFHSDRLPLYDIAYMTPFTTTDVHFMQQVFARMEERFSQAFQNEWDAANQVPLATTLPMTTYWLVSREPIDSVEDIQGMKISAAGGNLRWVSEVGATGINSAATDWYQHLDTQLSTAVIAWPDVTGTQKLCEPAKHALDTGFGPAGPHILTVNQDTWAKLPDEVKQAFREVAPGYAEYQADLVVSGAKTQRKFCKQEYGMEVLELSDDERETWAHELPPLALNWAARLDENGRPGSALLEAYMNAMREGGQMVVRHWDKE